MRRMRETLRRVVLTLLSCCCRLQRGLEGRSAKEVGGSPCGGHGGDAARDRGGGGGGHHHTVGAGVLLKTWEWIAVCVMRMYRIHQEWPYQLRFHWSGRSVGAGGAGPAGVPSSGAAEGAGAGGAPAAAAQPQPLQESAVVLAC